MFVRSFGLFWERHEVVWAPGQGTAFHMYGRMGKKLPGLRLADFREQIGIYVLYDNYGPYYVGLTIDQGFGTRLRQHHNDPSSRTWERFSWFGFRDVERAKKHQIFDDLAAYKKNSKFNNDAIIGDVEALLIKAMGPRQQNDMNFHDAEYWDQVRHDEIDDLESRLMKHKGIE